MPYFNYDYKKVYYEEIGEGEPLLLLHGNSASSRMFDIIIEHYKNDYKIISIDFLGHGKSDRLESFPNDFWYDEAMQVIELLRLKPEYRKANLIGTSGGALVALNVALEAPELVKRVVADSFEGETALDLVAQIIEEDRANSKVTADSVKFWEWCHGDNWEQVVDNDTNVTLKHHKHVKRFFHKDLSEITVPVLLTASLEDEFAEFVDFKEVYSEMAKKMPDSEVYLFETGGHPAMITNGKEFADLALEFFNKTQ